VKEEQITSCNRPEPDEPLTHTQVTFAGPDAPDFREGASTADASPDKGDAAINSDVDEILGPLENMDLDGDEASTRSVHVST
jgi:hypothetical protein